MICFLFCIRVVSKESVLSFVSLIVGILIEMAAALSVCSLLLPFLVRLSVVLSACQVLSSSLGQEILEVKYELEEESDIGIVVGNVIVDSQLSTIYSRDVLEGLHLRFLGQRHPTVFLLDGSTGMLRTANRLDRESLCPGIDSCSLRIDVAVQPIQFFRIIRVTVSVLDVNDNSPKFYDSSVTLDVLETAAVGSGLSVPTASDPDGSRFSIQRYEIIHSPHPHTFDLRQTRKRNESTELFLVLTEHLDRELIDLYQLTITAFDGGDPPRSGSMKVIVRIVDVNDNSPVFQEETYRAVIEENSPLMTSIVKVEATDPDSGLNGQIVYGLASLSASSFGHLFAIDNTTGQLFVNGRIDYEHGDAFSLVVVARDLGPDSVPRTVPVLIQVLDVNDNKPEITIDTLSSTLGIAEVYESGAVGLFVAHVSVVDKDSGSRNGQFSCNLDDENFELRKIFESEFQIFTASVLDREDKSEHFLSITCEDFGEEPQESVEHLLVKVLDLNDHDPVFQSASYFGEVIENNYIGLIVFYVNASDADSGLNAQLRFDVEGQEASAFQVNPVTGAVKAMVSFDRETVQQLRFRIVARDSGTSARSSSALALVSVVDVNDEKPRFPTDVYYFQVEENESPGLVVGSVRAEDGDSGLYGQISYSLAPGSSSVEMFRIDRGTGRIATDLVLDREIQALHNLVVIATDAGSPSLTGSVSVVILVADLNDNRPQFDRSLLVNNTFFVSTMSSLGHVITRVMATDPDAGSNGTIVYRILPEDGASELFSINQDSGVMVVRAPLMKRNGQLVQLIVIATDCGLPRLSSHISIFVSINSSLSSVTSSLAVGGLSHMIVVRYNLTVVVILSVISGVITICLITAIVFIRQQDSKQDNQYNCSRMDTIKVKGHKATPVSRGVGGLSPSSPKNTKDNEDTRDSERLKNYGDAVGRSFVKDSSSMNDDLPAFDSSSSFGCLLSTGGPLDDEWSNAVVGRPVTSNDRNSAPLTLVSQRSAIGSVEQQRPSSRHQSLRRNERQARDLIRLLKDLPTAELSSRSTTEARQELNPAAGSLPRGSC